MADVKPMDRRKDPNELKDWVFDWAGTDPGPRLEEGETIADSELFPDDGITVDDRSSNDDTTVTVWLSGGTHGIDYAIINRITTSAGRVYEDAITIQCRNKGNRSN